MKIVIIGNGLAGTMAAKSLRDLDKKLEIEILAAEKYIYYPRPNLIELVAGNLPYERLFAFPESWYIQQQIQLRLGTSAQKILPESKEIELQNGGRVTYDVCLLADGASAFLPPIKGAGKNGVFTLRTLDDALDIIDDLKRQPKVAVIGGGLLGLEIARAAKLRGADVEVVEFFNYLLPRQLDPQAGAILKTQIEERGMRVRLGVATEEILGDGEIRGLRFKNGEEISADIAIVAAGVRPNLALAKDAGLQVDKGVVVNDYLETGAPGIYAAGDGIQHRGRLYGIIPASFDQARLVASNILGAKNIYAGTIPANTLKVIGLYVTSLGLVNPEGGGFEEIRLERKEEGIYKKIVLHNGSLAGAIWMGTKNGVNGISRAVAQKLNVEKWKHALLDDNFDFSIL
jgi:nitrite reductase (NADH) large subunit